MPTGPRDIINIHNMYSKLKRKLTGVTYYSITVRSHPLFYSAKLTKRFFYKLIHLIQRVVNFFFFEIMIRINKH